MGVDVSFTFQAQPDAPLFLAVARRAARGYAFILAATFVVIALITAVGFHNYALTALYTGMAAVFALWGPRQIAERSVRNSAAKTVFLGPRLASVPGRPFSVQLGRRIVSVPTGGLTGQQHSELRDLLHSCGATANPASTI